MKMGILAAKTTLKATESDLRSNRPLAASRLACGGLAKSRLQKGPPHRLAMAGESISFAPWPMCETDHCDQTKPQAARCRATHGESLPVAFQVLLIPGNIFRAGLNDAETFFHSIIRRGSPF